MLCSDGESAILSIKTKVIELRSAETVPEESPVGEHDANLAEGAVRRVREQSRVILSDLEAKLKAKVQEDFPIYAVVGQVGATVVTNYQVGEDGRIANERVRGRTCRVPIAKFGERVLFREMSDGKENRGKIDSPWSEGVWIGLRSRSGEHIVETKDGVVEIAMAFKLTNFGV